MDLVLNCVVIMSLVLNSCSLKKNLTHPMNCLLLSQGPQSMTAGAGWGGTVSCTHLTAKVHQPSAGPQGVTSPRKAGVAVSAGEAQRTLEA